MIKINKTNLQIVTGLLALIPILTGLLGMSGIYDPIYANSNLPFNSTLDSNLRFYSGIWFAIGLTTLWILPRIEKETVLFRALWLMIFLGGLGRLISLILVGTPFSPFIIFTILEIIGAPLFIIWQNKISNYSALTKI